MDVGHVDLKLKLTMKNLSFGVWIEHVSLGCKMKNPMLMKPSLLQCMLNARKDNMPMYETTVRTPQGERKDQVYAKDLQEAKQLFEQRYGSRNVPFIPKIIPS